MVEETIESLRKEIADEGLTFKQKQEIRSKLVKKIKEKAVVKLAVGNPVEFHLTYDTFSGTLEPVYFWVLDFLRNDEPSGLGFEVDKTGEEFEATAGGGFFGELGSRATVMQERGMKILETVNAVLRTIINLIYDLKEFEMRLNAYDDANSSNREKRLAGEYSLKGIWMDQVDVKTGLGSINQLTRGDLQFVTMRDAFMQSKVYKTKDGKVNRSRSFKDVGEKENEGMDLNKRVKIILKKKLEEYFNWRDSSEVELRKRFDIETNYLKAQVSSLKLYTTWAKPYLRAAQKLGMQEFKTGRNLPIPDLISTFNSMQMDLKLLAKREFKPGKAHPSYEKIKFGRSYNTAIEVQFIYRTAPQVVKQGQSQHFAHLGTIDIFIRGYVFTKEDLDDIYAQEVYEDMSLVEDLTEMSLGQLQEDLDHYLYPKKEKEEKKESDIFDSIGRGLGDMGKQLSGVRKKLRIPSFEKKAGTFEEKKVLEEAQKGVIGSCNLLYDIFKKSHRMVTW